MTKQDYCPRCNILFGGNVTKCIECGYILDENVTIVLADFTQPVFLKDATIEQLKEELHKRQEMRVREEITAILTRALAAIQNGEEIGLAMGNMHNDLHRVTVSY